jgi:hypothetical protein
MAFMDFLPQFSDNTDQSGVDDPNLQSINLKRKLALANSLRNKEAPQGQMVSGHYVRPSWTQSLAHGVNQYLANSTEKEAMKEYADALKSQETKKQTGLARLLSDLNPMPTEQTTMQPTTVDLQQGMNVPTSPFSTTDQVAQIAPKFDINAPAPQNMQGQSNMMQPVTTQVPGQPLSRNDILGAVTRYGQTIGDNKIGESAILDYVKQAYAPKKTTWISNGNEQIQIDELGQPTGKTLPIGVSPNTTLTLDQSGKQHKIENEFKREQIAIEKKKLNPLGLPDLSTPTTKPLTNNKGWTLHTDAQGNQAYVSPDGKQFEETK